VFLGVPDHGIQKCELAVRQHMTAIPEQYQKKMYGLPDMVRIETIYPHVWVV